VTDVSCRACKQPIIGDEKVVEYDCKKTGYQHPLELLCGASTRARQPLGSIETTPFFCRPCADSTSAASACSSSSSSSSSSALPFHDEGDDDVNIVEVKKQKEETRCTSCLHLFFDSHDFLSGPDNPLWGYKSRTQGSNCTGNLSADIQKIIDEYATDVKHTCNVDPQTGSDRCGSVCQTVLCDVCAWPDFGGVCTDCKKWGCSECTSLIGHGSGDWKRCIFCSAHREKLETVKEYKERAKTDVNTPYFVRVTENTLICTNCIFAEGDYVPFPHDAPEFNSCGRCPKIVCSSCQEFIPDENGCSMESCESCETNFCDGCMCIFSGSDSSDLDDDIHIINVSACVYCKCERKFAVQERKHVVKCAHPKCDYMLSKIDKLTPPMECPGEKGVGTVYLCNKDDDQHAAFFNRRLQMRLLNKHARPFESASTQKKKKRSKTVHKSKT